jgi:hypothetical protein
MRCCTFSGVYLALLVYLLSLLISFGISKFI